MIEKLKQMLEPNMSNPNILGIILMGSISANANDERSDVDLLVICSDLETKIQLPENNLLWDIHNMSKDELLSITDEDWRANAFLTAKIIFDKTDWLQTAVNSIFQLNISEEQLHNRVAGALGAYLNSFYRSMKAKRRNNELGALLQANSSIKFLVSSLYNFNGLIAPYEDRIGVTLDKLKKLPLPKEEICLLFEQIASSGDPSKQSYLFKKIEQFYRAFGYDYSFDEWDNMLTDELVEK